MWQLTINSDKCQVLHLGRSNLGFNYGFSYLPLPSPRLVTDLGLRMDVSLSFSSHIAAIVSKARARCGVFFKSFISRDPSTMLKFYVSYIRPILEYCSVVWSPTAIGDIKNIERVQRYFSNKIPGCTYLPYRERLAKLSIGSLQHRRSISDLLYLYSIVSGSNSTILSPHLIHIPPSVTRGHNLKLVLPNIKYAATNQNFLSRTIPIWNNLPITVLDATSKANFKKKLSVFLVDPYC